MIVSNASFGSNNSALAPRAVSGFVPEFAPVFHTTLIIISVIIVLTNGLVIYLFAKWLPRHQPGNWLLLNLACADIMTGCIILPMVVMTSAGAFKGLIKKSIDIIHYATDTTTVMSACVTIFSLCAIASERYIFLCHPLKHRSWISATKAKIIIIVVWLLALIFALIPLIWVHKMFRMDYSIEDAMFIYYADPIYSSISIILFYFIPLAFMTFAFIKMFLTIHHLTKTLNFFGRKSSRLSIRSNRSSTCSRSSSRSEQTTKAKMELSMRDKRAALLFATMVLMFIISWTPYMTVRLLVDFGYTEFFRSTPTAIWELLVILRSFTSILNPILYTLRTVAFQEALKKSVFGKILRKLKLGNCIRTICPFGRRKEDDAMLVESITTDQQISFTTQQISFTTQQSLL